MMNRLLCLCLLAVAYTDAFAPVALQSRCCVRSAVHLQSTTSNKEEERTLRQELADKNSVVEGEEKYAVVDGEGMSAILEGNDNPSMLDAADARTTNGDASLQAKIDRIVKPRAYPLFLAEKAAEILEGAIGDVSKTGSNLGLQIGEAPSSTKANGTREKVVVLGTGWGAASYLKDIDTSLYDVTVISPRNYFLFTPMLAGASVGTVEYRSITEPIREVRSRACH